ncbi:glycosyl transferase family 2 [Mucilaginibacter yixingensis]|uniref:Glycosyl transferase family 2 n=1 Tax=Mucilaginibacter yixingensis TaxID=1295612 RepID=A0A2T5JFT9_9SPHI|nr:glycosyltransferase family 2 protein [Mucilaginibacter yixingensis]PTR01293.1 glycosyl transferase family 2 [Mucilaginibacter yixingensis]
MTAIKISIITVCYNAGATIERCIQSVVNQQHPGLEYIVIDGGSTDHTLPIINKYRQYITRFISEPDGGIYQAINKGLELATGDVIGILNADDQFAAGDILKQVGNAFVTQHCDVVYGDIDFVNADGRVTRRWRSGGYRHGAFNRGWMPPHPSFYALKKLYDNFGPYSNNYGTAADYELMLRFIHTHQSSVYYLPRVMVCMQIGGASNGNLKKRILAWKNDYRAMKTHGILWPALVLIIKPLRKLKQYLS